MIRNDVDLLSFLIEKKEPQFQFLTYEFFLLTMMGLTLSCLMITTPKKKAVFSKNSEKIP